MEKVAHCIRGPPLTTLFCSWKGDLGWDYKDREGFNHICRLTLDLFLNKSFQVGYCMNQVTVCHGRQISKVKGSSVRTYNHWISFKNLKLYTETDRKILPDFLFWFPVVFDMGQCPMLDCSKIRSPQPCAINHRNKIGQCKLHLKIIIRKYRKNNLRKIIVKKIR